MARKYGDRLSVFAVSPGASSSTNASRNMTGIKKFVFAWVMPLLGPSLGMDQPVEISAGRYVDVLNSPKW